MRSSWRCCARPSPSAAQTGEQHALACPYDAHHHPQRVSDLAVALVLLLLFVSGGSLMVVVMRCGLDVDLAVRCVVMMPQ